MKSTSRGMVLVTVAAVTVLFAGCAHTAAKTASSPQAQSTDAEISSGPLVQSTDAEMASGPQVQSTDAAAAPAPQVQSTDTASTIDSTSPAVGVPVGEAQPGTTSQPESAAEAEEEWLEEEPEAPPIPDPFEKLNRAAFAFNDKFYVWIARPVALGYNKVVSQPARVGVRNFFSNIASPVRIVNCLLQAKWKAAGTETARFGINTTVGVVGFGDPAANNWNIQKQDEDLGQTLGKYGIGQGFYINWVFWGPSSPRDTIGTTGDFYLNPINYAVRDFWPNLAVKAYEGENDISLNIAEYDNLRKNTFDPYVAVKHAYTQNRQYKVEDKQQTTSLPPLP